MNAAVLGVGTSLFGKQPTLSPSELVWRAVREAIADSGTPRIDAVFVGTVFGAPGVAQRALAPLGLQGIPILTVENACASGTSAFHEAATAVELGRFGHVLAVGVEKMTDRFAGPITPELTDVEGRTGLALPALYAMAASRYLALHDISVEDLAQVSVKNHQHGEFNERAQHGRSCSLHEVLASRMIADPLTLLQCCPIADGAAAAVVGRVPRETSASAAIRVRASALQSGHLWDHTSDQVWGFDLIADTAQTAYATAGIGPSDLDVIECHDAFTIGEIVTTEALGLAPIGGGAELVRSGATELGGSLPVNPSGGLLSRGHPLGATGLAQIAEITWQLRGQAGRRQVDGASIGLVETMGGGVAGIDGNACVVVVLER